MYGVDDGGDAAVKRVAFEGRDQTVIVMYG